MLSSRATLAWIRRVRPEMSAGSSSLCAVEPSDTVTPPVDGSRHGLFRYLTAEESADYLAIMDLFSATLLTDLSAAEVTTQLAERGRAVDRDIVEARCRQLVAWGNLVPSLRDAKVSTVPEYIRSRSRYQVSKLGGRLHREAVAILHATDGAREVARELLGQIVQSLDRILAMLGRDEIDADVLAGEVTTVFGNQRVFTDSIRDFYAYLAGILSRYDLGGEEYAQFKELLLVYIDLITADVNRHAPAVAHRIGLILKLIDPLLEALAQLPGLTLPDGTPVERAQGRTHSDWEELAYWYDAHGASGPEQLRAAAGQALGQLITNAKRLLDSSGTGFSRRADFLRLARWFSAADDDGAHRLYAATFGAYPSRHLLFGPDEPDPRIGPMTSWWNADPVHVPVSLRERGDRTMRGRTSRVPDTTADRLRLTAEARHEAEQRQAAAAELALTGSLHGATISPAARRAAGEMVAPCREPVSASSAAAAWRCSASWRASAVSRSRSAVVSGTRDVRPRIARSPRSRRDTGTCTGSESHHDVMGPMRGSGSSGPKSRCRDG